MYIEPDGENRLSAPSAAQCQHVRSVSVARLTTKRGNVGPMTLAEVREVLGLLLEL
ncbi:type II toxin-antitoxin system PemK/MazF family toxin [Luteococcus sp. OSA5]|uniref:type II toxin-antitoxin system PemK/MazF family toxin n=1 Tax=Luteococcus sp. OSA5 TaxID=3401630 RepID=UPI003B42A5BA